ncbi:maleylpyruvate isomerase N-terminal domain-containing protein [Pseudonocardia sp. DSM 110487]|uniref:maleylpyruvate isomerase N-terminal domain-containing protein n=1 Tax=Pseudonocardia sp. DSM 110487 TaxID=2865833 RepID=UPI001C696925|nr:maleylpyruvate isomerase N-terminal domain-containing protein [Pseudonocardia sp. DSM 110487]QYN32121.1 maleylpyruvate isomerase N-terminal domain-containing protein [Pseudonocardia sp. DSM 110487]
MHELVDQHDRAFPSAASIALELIRRQDVSDGWSQRSALPKMSIGALACHLGRQISHAAELLQADAALPTLESADAHYARAAWVTATSPDDPVNDRSTDDAEAELGPSALRNRATAALQTARDLLVAGGARDVVPIPWQGWSLRRHDFLLTRLLEIVVHSDDLAVSLDLPTPEFPDEAFAPVRDLLVRLAVRRHGQSALVSALTRRERARPINAF